MQKNPLENAHLRRQRGRLAKACNHFDPLFKNENCSWKTVSLGVGVEDLPKISEHQKGKAFTIYPTSTKQFAKIAHDLDYIIKQSDLQLENSEITGDRPR